MNDRTWLLPAIDCQSATIGLGPERHHSPMHPTATERPSLVSRRAFPLAKHLLDNPIPFLAIEPLQMFDKRCHGSLENVL